jgi:ubiquinone/menaquinone biosynthesis C-methylase UbiE
MFLGIRLDDRREEDCWKGAYGDIAALTAGQLRHIFSNSPVHQNAARALPVFGHILDGGCGLGTLSLLNPYVTNEIIGVDSSEGLLARARELSPHVRFEFASLTSLPFEDGTFDHYSAVSSLDLIPEGILRPLKEAHRVLKPGSSIFFATMRLQPDYRLTRSRYVTSTLGKFRLEQYEMPPIPFPEKGHAYWYLPSELKRAAHEAGFGDIRLRRCDFVGGVCYSRLLGPRVRERIQKIVGRSVLRFEDSSPIERNLFAKDVLTDLLRERGKYWTYLRPVIGPLHRIWSYWNVVTARKEGVK